MDESWQWVWVPVTLVAAAAQVGRNAIQRSLSGPLGTLGATQVRFLYGFPFALVFAALAVMLTGAAVPTVSPHFLAFTLAGALAQIFGTALMLAAMQLRAFVVVTVWTKTEPIQIAVFGVLVLGDPLSWATALAIGLCTCGILLMSRSPVTAAASGRQSLVPVVFGLLSAAGFAVSAVSFRGAILALQADNFLVGASFTLVVALGLQALMMAVWMRWRYPAVWRECLVQWRVSWWGGFLGAFASQGWFIGFALASAASVRTLGLVEVLFAQLVSYRLFLSRNTPREWAGLLLVMVGVACLLLFAA